MTTKTTRPYGTLLLFLFWGLLLAVVFFWYWTLQERTVPPELQGVLRPVPKPLQAFELGDQHQQPFNLEDLRGKWSFVFFGYTYCPDICPTTLSTLTGVTSRLENDPQGLSDIQVVFVSVDPGRDTPEVLRDYLRYFNTAFRGITGTQQAVVSLAGQFGAGFVKEEESGPGQYLISHTSSIFLVDPNAQLQAAFSPPHDPGTIVELFRQIRALY